MSTQSDHSTLDLRQMDRKEARQRLSVPEFERWEKIQELTEAAEEQREEWRANERQATDILVNATPDRMASDLSLWGNDLRVYYDPEDKRVREAAEDLASALGIDPESIESDADPGELLDSAAYDSVEEIESEDILGRIKDALVRTIDASLIEWNGKEWGSLSRATREHVLQEIRKPRPDGWGAAGLVDAWIAIQTRVEADRNDRLEQVRKFRNPERRGSRRNPAPDGV